MYSDNFQCLCKKFYLSYLKCLVNLSLSLVTLSKSCIIIHVLLGYSPCHKPREDKDSEEAGEKETRRWDL